MYYFRTKRVAAETAEVMDGFVRRQRYKRKPMGSVKIGVRLGEVYADCEGQLFEIVELYGGLCALAQGTNPDIEEPLNMDDPLTGWSHLHVHEFETYEKVGI